jgi:tetratricopeptide (TPR) repeat protein
VPRTTGSEVPAQVRAVADALLALSHKEGLTRGKIARSPALLALAVKRLPGGTQAEQARYVEDLIRTHVHAIRNLRDRTLLGAGLNLDQDPGLSFEARISDAVYHAIGEASAHFLMPESAQGRFRYQLTIELAWRLLGGAPTYAQPRPPSHDLELVERLRHQRRDDDARGILKRVASEATSDADRRDAWRLIATIAYEGGDYDEAEMAFDHAFQSLDGTYRGGKLAMAVDRYARQLTDEEDYDRALLIVGKALSHFFEGRWLWRRYGCIKWYAGDLFDAYSALTLALDLGYPASRIFHARGQVLAELGRYGESIEELDRALSMPRSSLSVAVAQSARAFAVGMAGDLQAALKGFAIAEEFVPDSGWLHFWRALCLDGHGATKEAVSGLQRALGAASPRLNRSKREQAERLLVMLITKTSDEMPA